MLYLHYGENYIIAKHTQSIMSDFTQQGLEKAMPQQQIQPLMLFFLRRKIRSIFRVLFKMPILMAYEFLLSMVPAIYVLSGYMTFWKQKIILLYHSMSWE